MKAIILTVGVLAGSPAMADPAATARAPVPAVPAVGTKPAAPAASVPTPAYVVVEGAHTETTDLQQVLTVICPAKHKVFGVGYGAIVRDALPSVKGTPVYKAGGLSSVRSIPDAAGNGWQVEGVSADAVRTHQPWKLVVRVVCVQIGA